MDDTLAVAGPRPPVEVRAARRQEPPAGPAAPALRLPVARGDLGTGDPHAAYSWSSEAGQEAAEQSLAAFAVLIHRYSGQGDIALGRVCGPGGVMALRSRAEADTTFAGLGASLAEQHRAPGPGAAAGLGTGLRVGVLFGSEAGSGAGSEEAGSEEAGHPPVFSGDFDLLLEVGTGARRTLHYDTGLFPREVVSRMAANHEALLLDGARRPHAPLHELKLSERETRFLLDEVNATARPFPDGTPLHALVEAQAARTPDAPAAEWRGTVLTYRELDARANRIARALLAHGVAPGARVGVSTARSHHTVCLLLALHKAGCAYVPLDPAYPADRLTAIAATAEMAAVVFDDPGVRDRLGPAGVTALPWAELWERAQGERPDPVDVAVSSSDATHLIYTSGSTGLPKGVVISHRNVVALLAWAWDTYSRQEVSRVLFATSLNFDLSVFELWCPLTMGGCVVVVDNVLALTEQAPRHDASGPGLRPSLVNTVPSALNVLLQRDAVPPSTVVLNVAGEPLAKELVNAAFEKTSVRRVLNLYGPSEDTTYSTWKDFTGPLAQQPTIGVPLPNTVAYVLDPSGRLVPRGAIGELHLGGAGLSRGYLNDPERTAAAFVPAPAHLTGAPVDTLYRTGDLVQWTETGELRFMGRKDTQVKVRGFRIELGEIEAVLRETVGLRDVAALAVQRADDTLLVCYVGLEGDPVAVDAMSERLRRKLPHYMQPAKIVVEDRLPRLPNGKVDRKALAARTVDWGPAGGGAEHLGDDPDEAAVARVWSDLLGLSRLSPDLDFFSVGGHSLLATLLAARLSEESAAPLRVADIHENRTLGAQAALLRRARGRAPAAPTAIGTVERLRAVARTLHESARGHGVPAAAAAVYADGALQFTYHGMDDMETGPARTADSRQRVTCITKALLAFVALRLVDRRLVGLDEPLDGLLPHAVVRRDGRTRAVTLRQLLCHTSGIDDSYEVWHDTDHPDLDHYLDSFRDYGQLFEPGEVFAYSACGTSIVAGLIEKLLGMPWRRALNELLLTPLGITPVPESGTAEDHYGAVATGYLWSEAGRGYIRHEPGPQTIADDAAGSFSICLTLPELARIAQLALDDGVTASGERLLSAELAAQMRTPQIDVPGHHFMHAWGLGWLMFGPTAFGFNSNGSGHHNFIQIFPEQRAFLLLLTNAYPAFGLYEDLLRAFTGEGLIRTGRAFGMALDDCVGRYESDGYRLDVLPGPERLRYAYAERQRDGDWLLLDEGDLVSSGAGGFTSMSERNILAGSISFIPTPGTNTPGFVRIGQRFTRKVR
ncbi:amino acid adenylation domain-containing protein [Streptomyces sp. NPDC050564]|uniref:amino acid adenylation domain-containing protein n=1 Tax=Streptomyces sp. NPDC050564 TaxID=3365631 RepID=UPI0037ACA1A6